jgi:hypothetical protein
MLFLYDFTKRNSTGEGAFIHHVKSFVALDQLWICSSGPRGQRQPARERCKTVVAAGGFKRGSFRCAAAFDWRWILASATGDPAPARGLIKKSLTGRHFSLVGNHSVAAAKQRRGKAGQPGHCVVRSRSGVDKFRVDEIAQGDLKGYDGRVAQPLLAVCILQNPHRQECLCDLNIRPNDFPATQKAKSEAGAGKNNAQSIRPRNTASRNLPLPS